MHNCNDGVIGAGPVPSDLVFVGIAPGKHEWLKSRQPFTGDSGQFLANTGRAVGFNLKVDCFATNICCEWNDSPTVEQLTACSARFITELQAAKPKLIVGLGNIVNEYFMGPACGSEFQQKDGGLKRGALVWNDTWNCWFMYTYHPSAIIRPTGDKFLYDYMRDMLKIQDVLAGQYDETRRKFNTFSWRQLHSPQSAQEWLSNLPEVAGDEPVGIDIETRYKTEPKGILCLSISSPEETVVIDGDLLPELTFPSRCRWSTQYGLFDFGWMERYYGIKLQIKEDTLLVDYSLDERGGGDKEGDQARGVGIHGLKQQGQEFLGWPNWDIKGVEHIWDSGPEGQQRVRQYNAYDAACTRLLVNVRRPKQEADNVRQLYENLMIPQINALMQMRLHGVYIDQAEMARFGLKWIPEWLRLEQQLRDQSSVDNLGSPQQIAKYLYDDMGFKMPERWSKNMLESEATKSGRTTNKYVLEQIAKYEDTPPQLADWLKQLRDWRKIDHLLSTYVTGIQDDIDTDGRIHPDPKPHGTRTGRMAYNNPPVQTIPNHDEEDDWIQASEVRRIFSVPSKDLELLEFDYKQAELWVAWMLSQDPALLAALQTGDFHAATTELVFGVTKGHPDFKMRRYDSKRVTFGIFYGRGANNLAIVFGHTKKWWQNVIDKWEAAYPIYVANRDSVWKHQVRTTGELVAPSGRKRRFHTILNEKILNEAINMPIQATGHDFLIDSIIKLQLEGDAANRLRKLDAHLLFEVHDSIMIEAPRNVRSEVVQIVKSVMEAPKFGLPGHLQVDVKAGHNWFDVEEA